MKGRSPAFEPVHPDRNRLTRRSNPSRNVDGVRIASSRAGRAHPKRSGAHETRGTPNGPIRNALRPLLWARSGSLRAPKSEPPRLLLWSGCGCPLSSIPAATFSSRGPPRLSQSRKRGILPESVVIVSSRDRLLLAFANLESYGIAATSCLDQERDAAHEQFGAELTARFSHGLTSYVFWLAVDESLFSSSGDLTNDAELPLHYSTEHVVPGVNRHMQRVRYRGHTTSRSNSWGTRSDSASSSQLVALIADDFIQSMRVDVVDEAADVINMGQEPR